MKFSVEKFKELFDKEKIGSWVVKNKKQVAAGCILTCLVIVAVAALPGSKDTALAKAGTAADQDVQSAGGATADAAALVKTEEEKNELKKNEYPEVNELVQKYYDCLSSGDMEGLAAIVDEISDEEKNRILSSKDLVEGYQNIECYTKRGLEEGSYVVFVYYEQKFVKYETLAPGLSPLYVCTRNDGSLYISNGEPSAELIAYVEQLAVGEDVMALKADVTARYEEAKAADPGLAGFENIKKEPEEEAPAEEPAEEVPAEETSEEEPVEEPGEEQPAENDGEAAAVNKETRFTESVKLRAGRGTDQEYLGTAYQGEHVTQIENYSDGWSKVSYNGKECYCMTEFLE